MPVGRSKGRPPLALPGTLLSDLAKIELQRLRLVSPERLRVAGLLLPVLQEGQEAFHLGGVRLVGREVLPLGRVVLQVEELDLVHLRIDDELPAVVAYGTLYGPVGREDRIAHPGLLAGKD